MNEDDFDIWEYLKDQGKKQDEIYFQIKPGESGYFEWTITFDQDGNTKDIEIVQKNNLKNVHRSDINLEDTYQNDNAYKQALNWLMDEINAALEKKDYDWFMRASKEYAALKMEGIK